VGSRTGSCRHGLGHRKFRPDVIVLRFSGTPRDGHGQHQASAIIGKEAFAAAADPKRFPEQLATCNPGKPKHLFFNLFSFTRQMEDEALKTPNRIEIDTGEFNPILGYSYTEIARDEPQPAPEPRDGRSGEQRHTEAVSGPNRRRTRREGCVEGIDTSWNRIPMGRQSAHRSRRLSRPFNRLTRNIAASPW